MQTLGLDGAPPPQPWYKLWAWPDVESPEDAIGAAKNGAIAAVAIGLLTSVLGAVAAGIGAVVAGAFFLLAAIGIRQLSFPASAMAVALYLMSQVAAVRQGQTPGVIGLALALLLVGAMRASWHALKMDAADRALMANDSPLETWTQRRLQQMGSPMWRKIRVVFNVFMFLYFAVLMSGVGMVIAGLA